MPERKQENIFLKAALQYAGMNMAVFPVKPKGKTPLTAHGCLDATTNKEQIVKWWSRWPDANIGMAMGEKSGGLIAIDLDLDDDKGINGYDVLRDWERENGELPETILSITGRGGYHYIYRTNKDYKNAIGFCEGIDVRSDGGYIIVPPSVHPNGHSYEWEQSPEDFPIAQADETVERFLQGSRKELEQREGFTSPELIPEGQRNATLFRLACSLRAKGLAEKSIRAAVEAENQEKCSSVLSDREVDTILKSAFRHESGSLQIVGNKDFKDSLNEDVWRRLACKIEYDKNGNEKNRKILQTVRNHEIVLDNDSRFAGKIRFNEFSRQAFLMGTVPWEEENNSRAWSSYDDSSLYSVLQSEYGLNNRNDFYDAIKNVSMRNKFHPVRDILDSLSWDGLEHVGNLLPDYLGAEDTDYSRQTMLLWMLGAVARVYKPGCKFDYTLILQGPQGLGKSTFLKLLALDDGWFNDSLDSLDSDKAAQSLMGSWIIELAELKALARTAGGIESVKRFLTATQDKYRVPYERRADIFLRQCVFAGTTNKSNFLSDETGNRRFLIVPVGVNEPRKKIFSPDFLSETKAAWAQAVHIWKTEQPSLLLPDACLKEAERLQADCMVDDGKIGIVMDFLNNRQRTCVLEIWQEALHETGRPQKWQASEIADIILQTGEWEKIKSPARFGEYGMQRGFQRNCLQSSRDVYKTSYCRQELTSFSGDDLSETPFD